MADFENKFYKVDQKGGIFILGIFYNPITGEDKAVCVRDYEYEDCSRDNDELYYMPIDKEVRRLYLHSKGEILDGDTIEVVKGRKVPIGTIAKVKAVRPIYDKYDRWVADYAYLENGMKTNVTNCRMVHAA